MKQLHLDSVVRIKLTPYGKAVFGAQERAMSYVCGAYRKLTSDNPEGYGFWTWQEVMWWFGREIQYCSASPFESFAVMKGSQVVGDVHLFDPVWVKLTAYGKEVHARRTRMIAHMCRCEEPSTRLEENEAGYSLWTLKALMWWFGDEVGPGLPALFNGPIELEEPLPKKGRQQ